MYKSVDVLDNGAIPFMFSDECKKSFYLNRYEVTKKSNIKYTLTGFYDKGEDGTKPAFVFGFQDKKHWDEFYKKMTKVNNKIQEWESQVTDLTEN